MNLLYKIDSQLNKAINVYANPQILGNVIIDNYDYIQKLENLEKIKIPSSYKFRPDRVAYEYYGHDSLFPIVLASNNLRTLFDFIPENLNNEIYLLKTDILKQILKI